MESFERRYFVVWLGAQGDAAQTPLATRDNVQDAKDQIHTIDILLYISIIYILSTWLVFPPRLRRNPREIVISRCGLLLAGTKTPFHQTASI
jgi:hypothetical protein